jgi:hypothetical protein
MACSRGKANPSDQTTFRLFADSAGYCQNPSSNEKLFVDTGSKVVHIAERAHIFSASNKGPRSKPELTPEQRGMYENLILLCTNCHTIIDKAEESYPDELITQWKNDHVKKIDDLFGVKECSSREEVRDLIEPVMAENGAIFRKYGPGCDDADNPESQLAEIWHMKILSFILPNNRKILSHLDVNRNLMTVPEKETLEDFRQHVNDFEARHLSSVEIDDSRYPEAMNDIFVG